ncbi:hypothetical protein CAPTEDRAFT_196923 [Capitella teleta]|uniref:G-protein coupled receptors family 1 profile domain-containing protein n=1 Tax=Capitella teleta TaxID=283909 RepID=R7US55_CAPTE|nr:hypothetical protein CAPTEDRAFT_196923 [Capitella teleta]|eukprot:ELU06231.1 hypothetical protein CAPTEDRAFT_196923 [Capitella teleta]
MDNATPVTNTTGLADLDESSCHFVCVMAIIGTVLGTSSIVLNTVFLVILRFTMKDRTSAYHRLVNNLSISDLLASLAFLVTQTWPQGPFGYIEPVRDFFIVEGLPYVFRGLPWMFFTSYLLTLTCMSMNQYIAVCKPWRYASLVTGSVVKRALVTVWLVSSLQIFLPLSVLFVLNFKTNKSDAMATLFTISTIEMQVWLAIYAASTLLNIATNVVVYCKIRALKKQRRFCNKSSQESQNLRTKQAAFVTVSLLLAVSVACRLPFPVFAIVGINLGLETDPNMAAAMNSIVVLLLYVNFFADPIIHVLRMGEVQKACKSALASCLRAPCCPLRKENPRDKRHPDMMIGLINRNRSSTTRTTVQQEQITHDEQL